ncbi:MAG: F0F1 ATP synthase subunit B [Lachnospiraceae bacterium]|jgi:F-type H+-transporting ATPase subunit b|nr:F0F1 ATP synthase subunit B [Lachnospiraceae bacterium]
MVVLTQAESMERIFDLDWQLMADSVLTLIAVAVLCIAMSYLLFNPVRKLLNDRKNKITEELAKTKADMEQAAELKSSYENKLVAVNQEAEEILAQARKRGMANEAQIVAKAKGEAQRIIERAKSEALLEREKVKDEVKREMIVVASLMAGKLVASSMDNAKQDQLIEDTLKEIGESTWLN